MALTIEQISEIIKTLGLVVGGLWAAWTFQKLQRVRAAVLDNEAKLSAIQKAHTEQEQLRTYILRQQPQLAIQLEVMESDSYDENDHKLLYISVLLKNEGEQNLVVQFENDTLTVGRIVFKKNGKQIINAHRIGPAYFVQDSDEPQLLTERVFRVGQQRRMVLAVLPIIAPGAYIIQFRAVYWRRPFDGEKNYSRKTDFDDAINAVEQTAYFARGKSSVAES